MHITPADEFDLETPAGVYELDLQVPYERCAAARPLPPPVYRARVRSQPYPRDPVARTSPRARAPVSRAVARAVARQRT